MNRIIRAVGMTAVISFKILVAAVAVLLAAGLLDGVARDFLDVNTPVSALLDPYGAPRRWSWAPKSDLENFVTANEAYFADHGHYGTYEEVTAAGLFMPNAGVTITSTDGGPDGFSASGTHTAWPDGFCAVYLGTTRPSVVVSKRQTEGEVACTREGGDRTLKVWFGVVWLLCAVASTIVLDARRKPVTGFVLALLLGPAGLLAATVLHRSGPRSTRAPA
jgi:hypothetical protein